MPSIVFGDQTVNLYNWAGYMDSRNCDFLAAAASDGQISPAFLSNSPNDPSPGYNVLSKLNIVQNYLLDGDEPISARLDAAEQVVSYLESCYTSAFNRSNYMCGVPGVTYSCSNLSSCDWSGSYMTESRYAANAVKMAINQLYSSYQVIRDTLLAGQNQEIDEAEVQVQLNTAIADLNNKIAQTQQAQDAAKLTAFIKDVLVYVLPVIAVVFLYIAFFRNKIK